ncbi:chemotaxis protein MotB [Brevundimonas nasdae]|uniref:OmpA family protein n=1 Tax=Brevundimonas nasdae TaxID=172043 RepID=A0ABX8TL71_9CAUL|nr:flagellar motor protein MotB [Brevundimonas nasdae]MBK6024212.1 OmpA family protein [Brevundimonas nasdae]MDQ0450867.1 chemotaxis protein MotB [Brevundimonas nasdae]QYC11394.1 OmpA family protein [Brevundimonas nasdae]QYC14182.1 OmpA family protein [Brevundimonas nasdae]
MPASDRPILIKKVKKVSGGGHHGGAWKVAYADFVTAMMAFFLLMWLINATDPEQKRGIAEYFAPANVSTATSGSGGILGGTALGDDGSKSSGSMSVIEQLALEAPADATSPGASANLSSASDAALQAEIERREAAQFASAAESLRQAMQSMPELAELSKQLIVDQTPEGLRIQLVDQEGRSMFDNNSGRPNARAQVLLRAIAKVINQLPNRISITGHTSAAAGSNRASAPGDWTLSSERANGSRLVLQNAGVDPDRIYSVSGKAGSDPLYPDDPSLAGNRRIAIVLLREAPVLPMDTSL